MGVAVADARDCIANGSSAATALAASNSTTVIFCIWTSPCTSQSYRLRSTSTPAPFHGDDLLGVLLHIHDDAEKRRHHLFPGLISVKHRPAGVGIKLVVGRIIKVSVHRHLAALRHL